MKKFTFITVCTFLCVFISATTATDWSWPKWLDDDIRTNHTAIICDPAQQEDESNIDRKLGCDCTFIPSTNSFADCSSQSLALVDSTPLPARLNVSLHIKKVSFSRNYFSFLDADTFGDVTGVHELDFSHNRIERIHNLNFTRLTKIVLSFNGITNLTEDAFANCLKLEEIDLSFNGIVFIEPNALNQLRLLTRLNLGSNLIGIGVDYYVDYEFKLQNMEWLKEIDLSNNSLIDFPTEMLNGTIHITKLNLRNNLINFIPPEAYGFFPQLQELDLSGNLFTTLPPNGFHGFKNLRTLSLNGLRDLELIEKHAFAGLRNLNDLSCERNHRLSRIDVMAFRGDPDSDFATDDSNPKLVKLSDNNLAYIEFGLLNWTLLEELILVRNPWMCDCNLQWVPIFNTHKPKEATELRDFTCYSPPPLEGLTVVDVDPKEMMCFSPAVTVAGALAVVLFCFVLIVFCSLLTMKALGVLPDFFNRFQFIGERGLPKYTPLPKPGLTKPYNQQDAPPDLEWDSTDLPPVYR